MKKLILIPTLLTATSLPLVSFVSCGKEHEDPVIVEGDMEKDGQPQGTHDQFEGSFDTIDDITDAYYDNVDKQLLADDLLFCEATSVLQKLSTEYNDKANIKLAINHLDSVRHRISFELFIFTYENSTGISSNTHCVITDTPFDFKDQSSNNLEIWLHPTGTIAQTADYLPDEYWNDKNGSFSMSIETNIGSVSDMIDYTIKDRIDEHYMCIGDFSSLRYSSKYFENVTLNE